MSITLVILALALVGYIITCIYQWRRLDRGEPKDTTGGREDSRETGSPPPGRN